ncbi:hypothetical protein GCM10027406_32460 [Leifsonia lichenia]
MIDAPLVESQLADLYARRRRQWNSALTVVQNFLEEVCVALLAGEDVSRLIVRPGRVKQMERALEKVGRKYDGGTGLSADEIPALITDLVGIKVLCKTLRDSTLLVNELTKRCGRPDSGIRIYENVTDYVASPKDSGYRARHLLLALDVPGEQSCEVIVELQVKTLLQDSWGELTHEDLYKPSGPLPHSRHHQELASTMAGLLYEVDKLADILARNLDEQVDPPLEVTQKSSSPTRSLEATVTHVGPRFALALDTDGRRGLIPAVIIRDLVAPGGRIDVDDYLNEGDKITVQAVEADGGYYLHPTDVKQLREPA